MSPEYNSIHSCGSLSGSKFTTLLLNHRCNSAPPHPPAHSILTPQKNPIKFFVNLCHKNMCITESYNRTANRCMHEYKLSLNTILPYRFGKQHDYLPGSLSIAHAWSSSMIEKPLPWRHRSSRLVQSLSWAFMCPPHQYTLVNGKYHGFGRP